MSCQTRRLGWTSTHSRPTRHACLSKNASSSGTTRPQCPSHRPLPPAATMSCRAERGTRWTSTELHHARRSRCRLHACPVCRPRARSSMACTMWRTTRCEFTVSHLPFIFARDADVATFSPALTHAPSPSSGHLTKAGLQDVNPTSPRLPIEKSAVVVYHAAAMPEPSAPPPCRDSELLGGSRDSMDVDLGSLPFPGKLVNGEYEVVHHEM